MKINPATVAAFFCATVLLVPARERSFQVTLQVVNDEGEPVPKANASVSYERIYARKESELVGSAKGITDESGRVTLEGKTGEASIAYHAELTGHYPPWGLRYNFTGASMFRWQPRNPTIPIVLKRIKNPVPMYAKKLAMELPVLNQPIGFDFLACDWVAPHGTGTIPDAIFVGKSIREGDRKFDWQLQATFPNRGDGIQRFKPDPMTPIFPSAYEAPADGYVSEWSLRRWRTGPEVREQTTFDHEGGYYIRVRSELDNQGNVVKALYGKIYGDFFEMVCYLNPDGSRNMEFNPKQNLFKPRNFRERDIYEVRP